MNDTPGTLSLRERVLRHQQMWMDAAALDERDLAARQINALERRLDAVEAELRYFRQPAGDLT